MKLKEGWPDNKEFEALFDELVPAEGNAGTLGGEVIRAVNKIVYRYYNDGDMIGVGYGNETCNPPARFLDKHSNMLISNIVDNLESVTYNEKKYEEQLAELMIAAVNFCKKDKDAKKQNTLDMMDFDDPSDYRYDDEDEEDEYDPWAVYDEEDEMDESFKSLNEKLEKFIENDDTTQIFTGTIKPSGDNGLYLISFNGIPGEFDVWANSEADLEAEVQQGDWVDEALDQLEYCVNSCQVHMNGNEITLVVEYDMDDPEDVCATFGADDDKPNYIQESEEENDFEIGGMQTAYVVYQDLGNGYFKILDKVIMPAPDDTNGFELMMAEQELEEKWEDKLEDPTIQIGTFNLTDAGYMDPNTDEIIEFEESLKEDQNEQDVLEEEQFYVTFKDGTETNKFTYADGLYYENELIYKPEYLGYDIETVAYNIGKYCIEVLHKEVIDIEDGCGQSLLDIPEDDNPVEDNIDEAKEGK